MVEYLNNITPQHEYGFHIESSKIRYLRNAVFGKKWSTTPLKNISMAQCNLDLLLKVMNERIQLGREIEKAFISNETYYGRLTTHP